MDQADRSETEILAEELAKEQSHIDRVYKHLGMASENAKQVKRQGHEIFQTDRADYHREENGTAIFERDAFVYQAAKRIAILDSEHEGLVFGRLDLADTETRYIGRIGVRDEDYEPLVIDWRARAAEPFYRATPTNPMNVIRRRVLQCRNEKVIGIEDDLIDTNTETDLVVLGEGALMAALTRARGHSMKDIVATIQAEQDEAIRADYPGVTAITGGPGTGKTVVALHRAAYLLYTNRKRLENGGVMVIGPSPIFMSYIERVLPSLGEDSVTFKSIGHVATDVLDFGSQRVDRAEAATVKGSLKMVTLLKRLVERPLSDYESDTELIVTAKGEVFKLSQSQISKIRSQVLANKKLNQGRDTAYKMVLDALYAQFPTDLDAEMTRERFEDVVSLQRNFTNFMNTWWPAISAEECLIRLADRDLVAELADGLLSTIQQRALVDSYQELLDRPQISSHADWTVADIALLDELANRLGPKPVDDEYDQVLFLDSGAGVTELVTTADMLSFNRTGDISGEVHDTYAHVLVDEAQDVTPMQWRMIRRRGAHASWTLVGDPAQSSYPNEKETQKALAELVGSMPYRDFNLTTNYRSPAEVFDLAGKVVSKVFPQADLPKAIRKTGVEPAHLAADYQTYCPKVVEQITTLANLVEGTIGVICPPSLIAKVHQSIDHAGFGDQLLSRVVVITALESKGLEYDAVIVVGPDLIVAESPGGTRVLYVALTRPTQRLVTLDIYDTPGATPLWSSGI